MVFEESKWGLQQAWSGGPGQGNGASGWLGVDACAAGKEDSEGERASYWAGQLLSTT